MVANKGLRSPTIRTAALACLVFFAAGMVIATIGPSLPALATRLEVNVAALGGLLTAFSIGVMLAQAAISHAERLLGPRLTLALSMVIMAAGGAAIVQGGGLWPTFAVAAVSGCGFGGILATGNTLIARLFAERSASALNGINVFFGVGSILGPTLAAAANLRFGTPLLALLAGTTFLALLAPVVLLGATQSAGVAPPALQPRSHSARETWLFGLLLLVYTGVEIGLGAWLTLYMLATTQLNETSAALFASSFWFALTVGRGIATVIGARISAQRLLWMCLTGLLLGALLFTFAIGQVVPTVLAVLLFGLSCGPVFPTTIALLTAQRQGASIGGVLVLGNMGGVLIPALIGVLLTQIGPQAVAAVLIGATTALLLLGTLTLRSPRTAALPLQGEGARS